MSVPSDETQNQKRNESIEQEDRFFFPDIIDGKIATDEFLIASRAVVQIVDRLGKLFAPVKYDMQGNIEKLTTRYKANKENHSTLQDMILLEKASGENLIATDALLWLRRGLHMIQLFFEKIIEDHKTGRATEDLVAFLKKSYKEALEPYHGWMAQQLFSLLSRMVPTRSQLLQALANGRPGKDETILHDMEVSLIGLRKNVITLQIFYEQHNLDDNTKV